MNERKYLISEIDEMRGALKQMFPWNTSYYPAERSAVVEDRLRTHMQNGTEPADLVQAAGEFNERQYKLQNAERMFREKMKI